MPEEDKPNSDHNSTAKPATTPNQENISQLKVLLSGYITGCITRTLIHSIDTTKARLQVMKSKLSLSEFSKTGFTRTLVNTYKQEGIRGLYRGLGISVLAGGPATALYFYTYDRSKNYLSSLTKTQNSFWVLFTSGIIAEICSCVLWVPIDVIKERQQVMTLLKTYHYSSSIDAIRQIHATEGIPALYRAYGATILTFGPFTGISLALYDKLKQWFGFTHGQQTFAQSVLLSGISGVVASIVTNPVDVVKVRMQVQRAESKGQDPSHGRFGYRNSFQGMVKLFGNEGFFGLFRGLFARMLFGTMSAALHLPINDFVKYKLLKNAKF